MREEEREPRHAYDRGGIAARIARIARTLTLHAPQDAPLGGIGSARRIPPSAGPLRDNPERTVRVVPGKRRRGGESPDLGAFRDAAAEDGFRGGASRPVGCDDRHTRRRPQGRVDGTGDSGRSFSCSVQR
ncbi:chitin synthase 6 [Streptomyces laurentii]|uniref:Chitin synthase 6 n=1 Tax=Streptomyces laurentii TaxID=39478 RepID=A0A160P2A7_STRLU|nr:chitin synthase 6 [Streptomyces laurentii]